jgi:hypothetical protein
MKIYFYTIKERSILINYSNLLILILMSFIIIEEEEKTD